MASDGDLTGDGGPPAPLVHTWKARPARAACPRREVVHIDDPSDRRYGRDAHGRPVGVRLGVRHLADGAHAHAVGRARGEWFDMRFTSEVEA